MAEITIPEEDETNHGEEKQMENDSMEKSNIFKQMRSCCDKLSSFVRLLSMHQLNFPNILQQVQFTFVYLIESRHLQNSKNTYKLYFMKAELSK